MASEVDIILKIRFSFYKVIVSISFINNHLQDFRNDINCDINCLKRINNDFSNLKSFRFFFCLLILIVSAEFFEYTTLKITKCFAISEELKALLCALKAN